MNSLESKRLLLRPWQLSDVKDLNEYARNELVGPNAGWHPHQKIQESEEIIEKFMKETDVFAIVLKHEAKVIGGIGLYERFPDPNLKHLKQREVGFVLNPKYWGNAYIAEAVVELIHYCFKNLELDLLWCGHFDFNHRSKRVNEKCGFKYQLKKDEYLVSLDNKHVRTLYYSISKEDYERRLLEENFLGN